jgi:succinate dehydrogenase/fumarate reductase flavoprotein subunit
MESHIQRSSEIDTAKATTDVVVVGSGAAGLVSGVTARLMGLDVILIEKDALLGGTTAISGGGLWIPCSPPAARLRIADSLDAARMYLQKLIGSRFDPKRIDAFLRSGPEMVAFLESQHVMSFDVAANRPDYYPHVAGATVGGRTIFPTPFDGRKLGASIARLRPPATETTFLGMMMRPASDLHHFLNVFRSTRSTLFVFERILRLARDIAFYGRSMELAGGNALVAHLYRAALDAGVEIRASTPAKNLLTNNSGVCGVRCQSRNGFTEIKARRGVILAAGGFPHDILRRLDNYKHAPTGAEHLSPAPSANTGDGIRMAESVGAYVPRLCDAAVWVPVSAVPVAGRTIGVFPHLIDRQKPGFIAVTQEGVRFVNESHSYHEFGRGLIAACRGKSEANCFLIADHAAVRRYGMGFAKPWPVPLFPYLRSGYLIRGRTIRALAERAGIDPVEMQRTVQEFNGPAREGRDPQFGRGSSAYNRYTGDQVHTPNPCIAPVERPPFYAVKMKMGELGTFAGVATDEHARVVTRTGAPIPGLYAAGNDMSHVMGGEYVAGGSSIGPAMTFGYIAAVHLANSCSIDRTDNPICGKAEPD